ncbi:MAG: DUF2284 domain-containing protein, partial [Parasporobacterium sp.]|nr:DUF2284 domain-containing protein [Parasporobacterium sp.]
MKTEELKRIASECGFTTVADIDTATLKSLPEVRDMCEVNTCGKYGVNWACPPGCGSIDECSDKMKKYSKGILVQFVGDIEDSMDWEG